MSKNSRTTKKPVAGELIPAAETQAAPQEKKPRGRPSKYTPEIAREIVERLSEGEPLRKICRSDGMPEWRTIYDWMYRDQELSAAIARARELGQDAIAEDILAELNDEPERILSEGGGRIDSGYVQLLRARAEIKLKLLAKWNPKRYGDRVTHEGGDEPIKVESKTTEELAAVLKHLELRIRGG